MTRTRVIPAAGQRGEAAEVEVIPVSGSVAAAGLAIAEHAHQRLVIRVSSLSGGAVIVKAGDDSGAATHRRLGDLTVAVGPRGTVWLPGVEQVRHARRDRALWLDFSDGFAGEVEVLTMPKGW